MTDQFSQSKRSKIMGAVKGKNTKLEQSVSKELWKRGIRFRKNVKSLFGKPDIAIKKYRIVIFIDSCFWHGCQAHCRIPSTNQEYWINKINRNVSRDKEVNQQYEMKSWHLLRIWEHELKENFNEQINLIEGFINYFKNDTMQKSSKN